MVSGRLISGKQYFEQLSAFMMSSAGNNEALKSNIADTIKTGAGLYDKPVDSSDDYVLRPAAYIHLRNALWIYPGKALPNNNGVLWRGKLSAIDGFCLGEITASVQSSPPPEESHKRHYGRQRTARLAP
jgi:hypothetical protein